MQTHNITILTTNRTILYNSTVRCIYGIIEEVAQGQHSRL